MAGIERKPDLIGKKPSKTVQEHRKPSFTETLHRKRENFSERQHTGNTSEAAQERTSSSSDRDSEKDAGIPFYNRGPDRRRQHWQETRRESSITPEPGESPRHWQLWQDNEVNSRPNERTYNTSELGQRKGGGPGESSKKQEEDSSKQREPMDMTAGGPVPQRLTRVATPWYEMPRYPPATQEDKQRWANQTEQFMKEQDERVFGKK